MSRTAVFALLAALAVAAVTANRCYSGIGGQALQQKECAGDYCTKVSTSNGGVTYDCDNVNVCARNDCVTNSLGGTTCCCTGSLCNSASSVTILAALASLCLSFLAFH
ncbi:unnamed protein product [Caenorhabditis auriculariae]|uniref:Uncharacterized protein n=1 Tax=Caenorhabditis auriculariae TaxID=2777116 RepID=A0A8S1HCV0_9PELO|nr:unnamed protein product [Caenorhabditis auriculariae]